MEFKNRLLFVFDTRCSDTVHKSRSVIIGRDAHQYIVVPMYCTIYYIVQYNIIYCKAKKIFYFYLLERKFTIYSKPA